MSELSLYDRVQAAAAAVRSKVKVTPKVGLILGSGLGAFADKLGNPTKIEYGDIPHFPRSHVQGHAGRLVIGETQGVPCVAMQGRVHLYEGHSAETVSFPARVLVALGAKILIITNAAGGINPTWSPGTLMLIRDHIDWTRPYCWREPGPCGLGPDRPSPYSARLARAILDAGVDAGIELHDGIYAALTGPSYETPAEIRFLRMIGADAVGMSTVPEALAARHMGIDVLGLSCITNMAAGVLPEVLNHEEVLETARRVRGTFIGLLEGIIERL